MCLKPRAAKNSRNSNSKKRNFGELAEELRSNPLLTPKAKEQKQQQLQQGQQALRAKVQQFEQQLRGEERRFTEEIFRELKGAIRTVSIRDKYDLVLEKNAAKVILYMKQETTDFTQKVIDHYNSLKANE